MSDQGKTLNNILVTIFSAALLSLGASHIYVLNKLALFEEKIINNKMTVTQINDKLDQLILTNRELRDTTIKLTERVKALQDED